MEEEVVVVAEAVAIARAEAAAEAAIREEIEGSHEVLELVACDSLDAVVCDSSRWGS